MDTTLAPTADVNDTFKLMSEMSGNGDLAVGSSQTNIDTNLWLQKEVVTKESGESITEEFLHMYWMDATEMNGIIYLFGKVLLNDTSDPSVKKYVSSCVAIHGNERNLFVLPAIQSSDAGGNPIRSEFTDVYKELQALLVPHIIPRQTGVVGGLFKCKKVSRKYAFEIESVPREETDYLKVVYSAKYGVPNTNQCAGQNLTHIERIFGVTTTPIELFLMKRKLMGPCWIKVRRPKVLPDAVSWCKVECAVDSPKLIVKLEGNEMMPPPPLVSMCLSMKTAVNPITHTHEIIALSGIVHTNVKADEDTSINVEEMKKFTMVRALGTSCGPDYANSFPHDMDAVIVKNKQQTIISTFPNERALLSMFYIKLQQEDPDVFASHNLFGFEFEVLFNRSIANKLPPNSWSKIGRLRRIKPPLRGIQDRDATPGRILCDTYKASKEFLRETTYSLTHLSHSQLNYDRVEVDPIDVPKYFSNAQFILNLANHTACDAFLVQRLMMKLQVIPLTKQLTTVSGNLWSRTARGARAERIEYLLLHEFHALKYILPEKKAFTDGGINTGNGSSNKKGASRVQMNEDMMDMNMLEDVGEEEQVKVGGMSRKRAKAAYAGGLVLEPKKGLYDTYILLLDFNSLYPSIIQEYDLCFSTVNWVKYMSPAPTAPAAAPAVSVKKQKTSHKEPTATPGATGEEEEEDVEEDDEVGLEEEGGQISGKPLLPPLPVKTPGQFKGTL